MDFAEFFACSGPGLVKLCYLTTLDREAAADIAQEAMTRAWRDWDRIGAEGSDPGPWVRTVALNLCRSRWRRATRFGRLTPRLYAPESPDAQPDVDLHRALARLPRRQREALVLHYWADLSVEACAESMGVSAGAVKQHLSRARATLGRHLNDNLAAVTEVAPL